MPNLWFGEWEFWEARSKVPSAFVSSDVPSDVSSDEEAKQDRLISLEKDNRCVGDSDYEDCDSEDCDDSFDPDAVARINDNINRHINRHGGDVEVVREAAVLFEKLLGKTFR